MKLKHALIINEAIAVWVREQPKVKGKYSFKDIICAATDFNWKVFHAAKVQGDSIKFLTSELYPYLTDCQIMKVLKRITHISGVRP